MVAQCSLVVPMMRRLGCKRAFELGGYSAAAALLVLSQCHRAMSGAQAAAMMLLAYAVMSPAYAAPVAGRAVLIEQAHATTSAGPGELSAAVQGAASLLGVAAPLFWGFAFKLCAAGR
jgi:hypothetical protein